MLWVSKITSFSLTSASALPPFEAVLQLMNVPPAYGVIWKKLFLHVQKMTKFNFGGSPKDLHAPRGGSVGRREVVIYRYLQPAVPKLCYMLGR